MASCHSDKTLFVVLQTPNHAYVHLLGLTLRGNFMTDSTPAPLPVAPERTSNRRFLLRMFCIGAALAVVIGVPACLYSASLPNSWYRNLTGQQLTPQEPPSIVRLGRLADFPAIGAYQSSRSDGCWVVRLPEDKLIAVNTSCTHDGCATSCIAENGPYGCPCCGSKFKMDGTILSGPADRPLERFKVYVDNNTVFVNRSETFQQGSGDWQSSEAFVSFDDQ